MLGTVVGLARVVMVTAALPLKMLLPLKRWRPPHSRKPGLPKAHWKTSGFGTTPPKSALRRPWAPVSRKFSGCAASWTRPGRGWRLWKQNVTRCSASATTLLRCCRRRPQPLRLPLRRTTPAVPPCFRNVGRHT